MLHDNFVLKLYLRKISETGHQRTAPVNPPSELNKGWLLYRKVSRDEFDKYEYKLLKK